ncbi:MAG: 50S ribosomal protein L29 [bacterium]|nr:50S ribosomal protein L29 [bacterium]
MAKKTSLKTDSVEQINALVTHKREELRSLRFSASGSKNRNVKLPRTLRKDIARALTEVSARKNNPSRTQAVQALKSPKARRGE